MGDGNWVATNDTINSVISYTITLVSDRAPMEGNFYAKDGTFNPGGYRGDGIQRGCIWIPKQYPGARLGAGQSPRADYLDPLRFGICRCRPLQTIQETQIEWCQVF